MVIHKLSLTFLFSP